MPGRDSLRDVAKFCTVPTQFLVVVLKYRNQPYAFRESGLPSTGLFACTNTNTNETQEARTKYILSIY